jgi:O-antigen ligase
MDRSLVDKSYTLEKLTVNPIALNVESSKLDAVYNAFIKIIWASFYLFLPVTNFPLFPTTFGGAALVRPLSLYPLILLFFLYTLPRLCSRSFPKTFLSLAPFLLAAVLSSLISFFRGIEPVLGIPVYERVLRTLLTLGIGAAIYFTVSLLPRSKKELDFSLRWMYAGLAAALSWGSLQAVYIINFNQSWFNLLEHYQQFISTRHLFDNRISGLTYEPNWFAEQLSFLYLPWLLASVFSGKSIFPWRRRWLTVELVLLSWTICLLPFTYSRAGVLNLVMVTAFGWFLYLLQSRKNKTAGEGRVNKLRLKKLRSLIQSLIQTTIIISIIAVPIYLVGTKNTFFARLWGYWESGNPSISGYLGYLGFDARLAFSEAAYNTFDAHPITGVGLGNYVYYFEDMLPYRPLADSPEVMQVVTPESGRVRLITAKNFYLRLLAETGAVGLAAFITFLVAVLGCALYLFLSPRKGERFWGTAGLCAFFTFLITAFSYDSFAIPNMWVVFGLITSAAWVTNQSRRLGD